MKKENLYCDISEATRSLLNMARQSSFNKISDNCSFILSKCQSTSHNSFDRSKIRKVENEEKIPKALHDVIPDLERKYHDLYDVNLFIYRSKKDSTIIEIEYYPRSFHTIEYQEKSASQETMLHSKVCIPPYAYQANEKFEIAEPNKKFDINWQLGTLNHRWKMFCWKRKMHNLLAKRQGFKQVIVKKVVANDLASLQHISQQTFSETFAAVNTTENLNKYLQEELSLDKLEAELLNPNSEFYFALLGNKIIGYIKINFGTAQTELKEDKGVEIERIYVLKDFLGKKVGQMLYDKAIEIARKRNADYVWLGVWEENPRAIQFYKKNGFVQFDQHIFKVGEDEQIDVMMRREL